MMVETQMFHTARKSAPQKNIKRLEKKYTDIAKEI